MKEKEYYITKTKQVLEDLEFEYNKDIEFEIFEDTKSSALILPNICVSISWYNEDYLGGMNSYAFLIFDSITDLPLELSFRSGGGGIWIISQSNNGKYFVK